MQISFEAIVQSCQTVGDVQRLCGDAMDCGKIISNRINNKIEETQIIKNNFAENLLEELE